MSRLGGYGYTDTMYAYKSKPKGKWNPLDPEFLAQLVHLFVGGFFGLTVFVLAHFWNPLFWIAIPVFMFVILLKEMFWDPKNEANNPFWPQGVIDWTMYLPGIAMAAVVWGIVVLGWLA